MKIIEENIMGTKMQASENRHSRRGARTSGANSKLEDMVEENIPALTLLRHNTDSE